MYAPVKWLCYSCFNMVNVQKIDEQWRAELSDEQYRVMRKKGTEAPYSGSLSHNGEEGAFVCSACGAELFMAETKFDSGSGWPSFYDAKKGAVEFHEDTTHGMVRTEVTCANCGGHLGHVFPDAPDQPTGQRYCINAVCLGFKKKACNA